MRTYFFSPRFFSRVVMFMRVALGIIFLWFGFLKLAGRSPVGELLAASFPVFAGGPGALFLALFEIVIGAGLLVEVFPATIAALLMLHLVGTFGTFITAPRMMFDPYFPFLTLEGEFVVKNLGLAAGGLLVLWGRVAHISEPAV